MPIIPILDDLSKYQGKITFIENKDYYVEYCSTDKCLLKLGSQPIRVVQNGQTERTLLAGIDQDYLLVPIQSSTREKSHPLGIQNDSKSKYEIWKKLREIDDPNLMGVIDVCRCTAKVKIVNGKPLVDIGTMPNWQKVMTNSNEGIIKVNESISFEKWIGWMGDLSKGLLTLHQNNIFHGDAFPFNVVIENNSASWIDFSHVTDDETYREKDIYSFLFFTCLYTSQYVEKISPRLMQDILGSVRKYSPSNVLPELIHMFGSFTYDDFIPNRPGLINEIAFEKMNFKDQESEFFYRGSIHYFESFVSWMKAAIYLKSKNETSALHSRIKEYEVKRLMIPRGEYEDVKNTLVIKQNELIQLNEIHKNLKAELDELSSKYVILHKDYEVIKGIETDLSNVNMENTVLREEKVNLEQKIERISFNIAELKQSLIEKEELLVSRLIEIYQNLMNAQSLKSYKVSKITRAMKHEYKQNGVKGLIKILRKTSAFLAGKKGYFSEYNDIDPFYQITASIQDLSNELTTSTGYQDIAMMPNVMPELRKSKTSNPTGVKRVAYFTNQLLDWFDQRPRYGGGERYCISLADLMRENGLQVDIYQIAPTEFEGDYYNYRVRALRHGEFYSEFNIDAANQFYEISLEYDHVIYNMPELSAGKMRPDAISITHGIWFDHNNYGPSFKFREKEWFRYLNKAYANPKRIVSVDTNSVNVIRSFWPDLATKMKYIPNFVDLTRFYPPPNGRNNEKIKILFPRRSQINRGSRILEDILLHVPHDVEFYWVGEGDPYDTELIKALTKKDLRLHYEKDADFDEMSEWYRKCDIVVIPTIACEGTSLSCIEALASGCATISTNVGGLTDIIQDEYNGRCVNPDPIEIANAINELIENRELMLNYQQTGLNSSYAFSLERWRSRWKEVLIQEGWIVPDNESKPTLSASKEVDLNKINVAIVTRNAYHGGVESLIKIEQDKLGATVFVTGGINNPNGTCPFTYKYINSYEQLVQDLQLFDVILYHWPYDWVIKAIRDSGVPSVEFVHRTDTSECDKSVPTAVVTHSEYIADFIRDEFNIDAKIIPNVVDPLKFSVRTSVPSKKTIGLITSYYKTKGIDVFLKAWSLIHTRHLDCSVRIYGNGDEKVYFEQLAKELGIKVEFHGPTSNPEKVLMDLTVYVTASRIEGLPISVLEALSCDVPVIASSIDGHVVINDLAENHGLDKPLILFESENPNDLANKLDLVLSGENLYKENSGPQLIKKLFSPDSHVEKLKMIFADIIHCRRKMRELVKVDESYNNGALIGETDEGFYSKKVNEDDTISMISDIALLSTYNQFVCYRYPLSSDYKMISINVECNVQRESNVFVQTDILKDSILIKSEGSGRYLAEKNSSLHLVIDLENTDKADHLDIIIRPNPNETVKIEGIKIISYM